MIFSHARDHLASGYNWPWNYPTSLPSYVVPIQWYPRENNCWNVRNWPSQSLFKNNTMAPKNSFLEFWVHFSTATYIFCHVVVSLKLLPLLTFNFFIHNIGVYKKCTLYKIPSMSSFFAPSTNETPFPNLQPRSENVQEYKRAKKVQDFPLLASAKCLYGLGKSGVAARLSIESET